MSDCILNPQKTYGVVHVGGKKFLAHRMAYCKAKGIGIEEIDGLMILHSCDNPRCINPDHLRIGTHSENMAERNERLRLAMGSRHGMHKIDEGTVNKIRADYVGKRLGMSLGDLVKKYGISKSQCYRIVNGYSWRHVCSIYYAEGMVERSSWSEVRSKVVTVCTAKRILLEEIAKKIGVSRKTLNARMDRGLTMKDAEIISSFTGLSIKELCN